MLYSVEKVLLKDGLNFNILSQLSYLSKLGINLKRDLRYFDTEKLMEELIDITQWYDECEMLHSLNVDYRIKSIQSAKIKFERYFPDHQFRKVFNDILGFRILCDNYQDVLNLSNVPQIRVADMSNGKATDDGYRGIHVYYQKDNLHYPIEIQYNTYYDRQFNNWLHKYLYKKSYQATVGRELRNIYEMKPMKSEREFEEALNHVLFSCKEI